MTPCECLIAGQCSRHGIRKNSHWHMLCRTREDYFDAWEERRGPGQPRPPNPQLAQQVDGIVGEIRLKRN